MAEFRVRARAVDMLGRQQIAGIPTAIHELFKNAHDAYAENVEVDYFRDERLFVLRDDGLGMTREDIETRWLTLGTESRLGANDPDVDIWTGPKNLPRRVIAGEKGIGRLAIAAIGPVTLLISRAVRVEGLQNTVTALMHWSLFEQPGIDVSSIVVPVRETDAGIPPKTVLEEMIEEVHTAIRDLADRIRSSELERLVSELDGLRSVDPQHLDLFLNQDRRTPLSLSENGFGTWFIVAPTASELNDDIDRFPDTMGTSNFNKVLLGFANTMDQNFHPVIETGFRDHRPDGPHPLIGPKQFFAADDFAEMDHLVEGEFDDRGQFTGRISFYGESSREFVLNWTAGKGQPTRCGPFRLRLGALQGRSSESRLDRTSHAAMSARLNELGGLYIYKDGIRVLPYGTAENDFIGIELRRTLSAQDWYFSYRRMIGFVALSHSSNPNLFEKAGREGFRENHAYRDLKSVLEEFFKSVSVRFFRSTSDEGADYQERKEEYILEREAIRRRNKRIRDRRKHFQMKLNSFRSAVDNEIYETRTKEILDRYLPRIERLESEIDSALASKYILKIASEIRSDISSMHDEIVIPPPRGLPLTKQIERDWAAYKRIYPELLERTIGRLEIEVAARVADLAETKITEEQRLADALETLNARKMELYKEVAASQRETWRVAEEMHRTLKTVFRKELGDLRDRFEETIHKYSLSFTEESTEIEESWNEVEHKLRLIKDREMELVDAVRRQLSEFRETIVERTTVDDEVAALEQSVERLREQLEFQSELAQIGMSVGILGHEFNHTIAVFRDTVHELKDWADATEEMRPLYKRLRTSFESLEGYLQMLTPLGRRLTRRRVEISGSEIELYVRRIFSERLQDHNVRLISSPQFNGHVVNCRTASLLGAFVNIVDNALYWIGQERDEGGEITFDAIHDAFLIGNNGPGISNLDAERIFEFGWTSKPGGAGMGLSLARDALKGEGFGLELRQFGLKRNPVFAITTHVDLEDSE